MKLFLILAVICSLLCGEEICFALDTATVSVSAIILSRNVCHFRTNAAALDFGNLDPANPTDVNAATSIEFRCGGNNPTVVFAITDDDGLYEAGPNTNRMRHAATPTEYIPYTATFSPTSGTIPRNTNQTLAITGTVLGANYQNVELGAYADSVILTILP